MIKKNRILYSLIAGISILCLFCIKDCFANPLDDWKNAKAYKPNPILFVHGLGSNSTIWKAAIEGLSGYFLKYQAIGPYLETIDFPDNIGSIDSYPDGKKGCTDDLRDRIEILLDKTKYGFYTTRLNLICHSMGGLAAREFLTNPKYPAAYVDKLILIGVPHLGSPLAPAEENIIKFYSIGSLVKPELFLISCNQRNSIDSFAEIVWIPDIDVSEAVKDMFPGSNFLNILNDRIQPGNVEYYGIYGIIGHLLNLFFFKDFYGGDGVVSEKSQLGTGRVVFKKDPQKIKAFHNSEPALSVVGDNPLLKFLDSTVPEFEITSPDPNIITETYVTSINIQGKVYKEYLPADTRLIINVTREEDGQAQPEQSSLLNASDLWIPNNPDSPVAEFDELISFPGKGTYKISCQLKNPAGLTSDIKDVWVRVITGVSGIIVHCHNPEGKEIASIEGVPSNIVRIYDSDNLIGYGVSKAESHNKPIGLTPGIHTIKAEFNGMTLQENVNVAEGETKIIIFIFPRTEFDIKGWLNSELNCNSVTSLSGVHSAGYIEPNEPNWWGVVDYEYFPVDENKTLGQTNVAYNHIKGYYSPGLWSTISYAGNSTVIFNGTHYQQSYSNSVVVEGNTGSGLGFMICNELSYSMSVTGFPKNVTGFDSWYVQSDRTNYPNVDVGEDYWGGSGWVALFGSSYDGLGSGYRVKRITANLNYKYTRIDGVNLQDHFTGNGWEINNFTHSSSKKLTGTLNKVKMSSVPYDLTGSAI